MWVTGFTDAEGTFSISIVKNKTYKLGWTCQLSFKIGLHEKDKLILELIQKIFDTGTISKDGAESLEFRVRSIEGLHKIIQHFEQYPLITKKWADFKLFKDAFNIINNKQHLTQEGLESIVGIKEAMNLGITDLLKNSFTNIPRVEKPLVKNTTIFDFYWLSGFTAGEGCFMINISTAKTNKLGFQVRLCFQLTQHSRDELLMKNLAEFLNCGSIYSRLRAGKDAIDYKVLNFENITEIIIPLFKQYPILGVKSQDFSDWCKVADLIKQKAHLTIEGLDQIKKIQTNMNRSRVREVQEIKILKLSSSSHNLTNKRHFSTISKFYQVENFNFLDSLWILINRQLNIKEFSKIVMLFIKNKYLLFINYKYVSNIKEILVSKIFNDKSENFKLRIKEFFKLSMLVGISEAICLLSTFLISTSYLFIYSLQNLILECKESKNNITNNDEIDTQINIENTVRPQKDKDERFFEWLAGFIDGDGCFLLTKKGYASLEIVTQLRDKKCLYLIKQRFGGSVKLYSGNNYLRYRLHHKEGLLNLIDKVNGLLQNPIRIIQLGKICEKYNLILKDPKPLTYYNGWLAGFFDTDGSIFLNEASGQIFITATQKNRFILEALVELYGGTIYPMVKQGAFKWTCFRKKEVLSLVNNYFKINPCRSEKLVRINMVDKFFEFRKLHAHKSSANSVLGKAWKHFIIKWNSILSCPYGTNL